MIQLIWEKEIAIQVTLNEQDNADWIQPLPLIFAAKWNHYIGFYFKFIRQFFANSQPYPYQLQNSTFSLCQSGEKLNGTQIVSHLYILHALKKVQPLKIKINFRIDNDKPKIDLKKYYKNTLKASTCIRYGKFGSSVITVDMTVNNVDDMFYNFESNNYRNFIGSTEPESENLGFHYIINNRQKIQNMGIRIFGTHIIIERSVAKNMLLSTFMEKQFGQNVELMCHGVMIKHKDTSFANLQLYCHPDGFLYFTI